MFCLLAFLVSSPLSYPSLECEAGVEVEVEDQRDNRETFPGTMRALEGEGRGAIVGKTNGLSFSPRYIYRANCDKNCC